MLAAAVAVVITAFMVTVWLWAIAGHAKPGTDQATARLDAVRTGLAAGAGAGAAVGLMLAFRRQHHQEIATGLTDHDATERRITELYTKAVEQLGNDKAPVRLGGLYALERLAQDNAAHRQTIVNVICAYLRMPFSPTDPTSEPEPEATEDLGEPAAKAETRTGGNGDTWQQERQVRLTAQRILAEHLRDDRARDQGSIDPPDSRFWPGIRLNLDGATLIDFNLENAVMADANFAGATFTGNARFAGATFTGDARFAGATFTGDVRFDGATFTGDARFSRATFTYIAGFDEVTFTRRAWFDKATLTGASFGAVTFTGDAEFGRATFPDGASFFRASFTGDARFGGATFSGTTDFDEATFTGAVMFDEAKRTGNAAFGMATFSRGENSLSFEGSRVRSPGLQHIWPTGWRLRGNGSGGYTVVRANDDASQPIPGDGSDRSRS